MIFGDLLLVEVGLRPGDTQRQGPSFTKVPRAESGYT